MATSTEQLQQILQRVKPWTTAAIVLAVVLGAYYLYLGFRFWNVFQDSASLSEQMEQIAAGGLIIPDTSALDSLRETREQQLANQAYWYSYTGSKDLLGKITSVAEESRVDLISVNGGEVLSQMVGALRLDGQPMTVSIQGDEPEDIYRFITILSESPPVTTITDIQINGLDGETSADIKLMFFLLPESLEAASEDSK
ncbi:MAG: hypothetical protein ACE5Q6_01230 [Dehalococcoidia bacterium]